MTIQTPKYREMICRLETLERQNRIMKYAGLVFAALALVIGMTTCQQRTKGVVDLGKDVLQIGAVQAQKFVLLDSKGRPRAELGMTQDEPRLVMYDQNGQVESTLGTEKGEPTISFYVGKDRQVYEEIQGSALGLTLASGVGGSWAASLSVMGASPTVLFDGPTSGVHLNMEGDLPTFDFVDNNGQVLRTVRGEQPDRSPAQNRKQR